MKCGFLSILKKSRTVSYMTAGMVEARRAAGKSDGNWNSGEAVFNWWMYGTPKQEKQVEGQMEFNCNEELYDKAV